MKIKHEDFEQLTAYVKIFDTAVHRSAARAANFSNERYRWALFHGLPSTFISSLYKYLNDANIDTALRRIGTDL